MPARAGQPSQAGTVPWPDEVAARYAVEGYWEGLTLGARLVEVVEAGPDRVALVDGDVRFSYRELLARADGAALRLRGLGLRPDDRMIVQLQNGWEHVVLTLGCFRLGVIPVMALPAYGRHELSYLAELSQARAIAVSGDAHQALARTIADGAELMEHVLVAGPGVLPGHEDLHVLCAPADDPGEARAVLDLAEPGSGDVALMLLSGGTTGLPKLIARTHDDYACYVTRAMEVCGYEPGTVYLGVLPFGHNFTLGNILGVLYRGGRVVVAPSPAPKRALAVIEGERVTVTSVVPAVAAGWLDHLMSSSGPVFDLASLRSMLVGGARLPDELALRIRTVLGCVVQQGYGMAEGLVNLTRLDDPDTVTCHTQGRPICGADELLLVGDDGEPVPPGEPGRLFTRGPYTVRGYYRAPEHDARSFTPDGWYGTGDIVRIRPDGNLVVEGRDKDMINRGGENISAEEVENLAYRLEGVRLAAAVAMPDPVLGERVCLYVVPHEGTRVRLLDLVELMDREGVARFKRPERLVAVDALPLTPIGKTDKNALRADIAERLANEAAAAVTAADATVDPGAAPAIQPDPARSSRGR